jgi:hypothetical protein
MVDLDVRNGITPVNTIKQPSAPTVSALKAAISGSAHAAKYPAAFMHAATYNDLVYVCRLHGIAVAGL